MKIATTFQSFLLAALVVTAGAGASYAQGDCYSMAGCSDYSNFGYNATSAATLEYDNYVSAFHSSAVRDIDGTIKVWGEMTQADGRSHHLMPTPINPGNYPGLTGTPLKIAMGSVGRLRVQFVLLTDDNKLWTWGRAGSLVSRSLTTNTYELTEVSAGGISYYDSIAAFQELSIGLPAGVSAADVKMLFGANENLVITTCSGSVYALVQYWGNVGNGGTAAVNVWHKVQKSTSSGTSDLTGIVAARGNNMGFVALDDAGNLWTWGYRTYNGSGPLATRNAAVQMTLPAGASGAIKMIGMNGLGGTNTSYYVLYENGDLYALGNNSKRELGDWTTTNSETWVRPRYTSASGPVMDNIVWISPQEHDFQEPFINVLTEDKMVYNWGAESGAAMGRGIHLSQSGRTPADPGVPIDFEAGYSNSDIISLESGGHTTMLLKECEGDFGYIGHRIHGSMGDNNAADYTDNTVHFNTNAVQVCGAVMVDAVLNASVEGPYYVGNTLTLFGSPSGGVYAISSLSTASATLTDSVLVLTGAGTLRVDYTVAAGSCGDVTVSKMFNVVNAAAKVTIPGNIWIDADGNALMDAGEPGIANGTWANLVDPNGIVIASVRVNQDGTYQFEVGTDDLDLAGDYSVILTNAGRYSGDLLTESDAPGGNYEYTGTNRGSAGAVSNKTGIVHIGDLSAITTTTTTAPVNFGMQQPPVADDKLYIVDEAAFGTTASPGFPPVEAGYKSIAMSSAALTGITGGSLSGTDPEDCALLSSCNTGTGTTYTIHTIHTNTRLFYDFGAAGVMEIDWSGGPVTIENFDAGKMIIWGEAGAGLPGNEIGFTYSITDAAGAASDPVSYLIQTSAPLPVSWLYFSASRAGASVQLSWATAAEINNKGFEVEHSTNGLLWEHIGFVTSKAENGNSSAALTYGFKDMKPASGLNYYRLKQISNDHKYLYSSVQQVRCNNMKAIGFYPNPANDRISISGLNGSEVIRLYDVSGSVLKAIQAGGRADISIPVADLPQGVYQLVISGNDHILLSEKVIKL